MEKIFLYVMIFSLFAGASVAQDIEPENSRFYIGVGLGLDYGGVFGGKVEVLPLKNFSLFAGGGYNLSDFGWNAGVSYKFTPENTASTYLMLMYGHNGTIKAEDYRIKQYETVSIGPSIGGGIDLKVGRRGKNKMNVGLLIPFRSKEFRDNKKAAKDDPNVKLGVILPIGISVGYSIGF